MELYTKTFLLILILINPFLMMIYLLDLYQELDRKAFFLIISKAILISTIIFISFGFFGDLIFESVLQTRFASFQIFGGIIFLFIAVQFVFQGDKVLRNLRGDKKSYVGSIVMPIMVGPGTVSASIIAGERHGGFIGGSAIVLAMVISFLILILLKMIFEKFNKKNEKLMEHYIDITGRISSLVIGTFSIEMIMQGIKKWH